MRPALNVNCVPANLRTEHSDLEEKRCFGFQIPFLEGLIDGNIPQSSNILLLGPPGVGKTIFGENLVNCLLSEGTQCVYVTLDKAPDDVRVNLQKLGAGTRNIERRLTFVDGFNWLVGNSEEGYRVENLGNLTELSIQIASAAGSLSGPKLLVFDSISPLSVYNTENIVTRFLQIQLARTKDWQGLGIYILQKGVHSDEFCNTLGYLVDGIFDMQVKEERGEITRHFRIRSLKNVGHHTKWMPFQILSNREFKLKLLGEEL